MAQQGRESSELVPGVRTHISAAFVNTSKAKTRTVYSHELVRDNLNIEVKFMAQAVLPITECGWVKVPLQVSRILNDMFRYGTMS